MNKRKRYIKRRLTKAYKSGKLINDWKTIIQIDDVMNDATMRFDRIQQQINSLEKAIKKISSHSN